MASSSNGRLLAALLLLLATPLCGPPPAAAEDVAGSAEALDLYLEVFVNGVSSELVGHFRRRADGAFFAEPEELREVGIAPAAQATGRDGWVALDALPGVAFDYDEAAQTIAFTSGDEGRAARVVDAARFGEAGPIEPETGTGALMNYSLLASTATGAFDDLWSLDGLSAVLEPRLYGPFGVLDHSMIVSGGDGRFEDMRRLSTTWSFSDTSDLRTYRIGDVVTGGLSWTRPVRLGGLQVQSDFALRPDLVTFPVPSLSGSAAVPSTVEVYLDNARRYSAEVPAGPFEIANLPVVEGGSTARLVVRDAQGVERVTQTPFFASTRLLAPGLADYSAEFGFARRSYGVRSDDYDDRPMGSASLRYGWTEALTLEAHGEGGEGLANGGLGAVFTLGSLGVASLAGAASRSDEGTGALVAAQLQAEWSGIVLNARSQRTFGPYDDIASVTAEPLTTPGLVPDVLIARRQPRELDQIGLSFPLGFDPSTLSVSLARIRTEFDETSEIAGLSWSRALPGNASLFASGFASLDGRQAGLYAGLSFPLGERINGQIAGFADSEILGGTAEITRSAGRAVGDYGWRLRAGAETTSAAAFTYNAAGAQIEAGVESFDGDLRASARAEGAVVFAGGRPHLTRRIDDAFALVDIGAPGVEVLFENRPVGRSGADGRILVPDLRSNERNDLSFDPQGLPLDMTIGATRRTVVPARRSGASVDFGLEPDAQAALVSFRRPDGGFVAAGSAVRLNGEEVLIGYDGQAYLPRVEARNEAMVEDAERGPCLARFDFSKNSEQTMVSDVACVPLTMPTGGTP